jgi:hypothetical protein
MCYTAFFYSIRQAEGCSAFLLSYSGVEGRRLLFHFDFLTNLFEFGIYPML